MSYHHSHNSSHHPSFLNAHLPPINFGHGHGQSGSSASPGSLLGGGISSHSFPMAPTGSSPSQPHPTQQNHAAHQHQQHQQPQQQQQQMGGASTENLITPDSMPLEVDFDTLDSASSYMHTYALSQGFDIRIQWSANNQTRICWSCYRGGFPESSASNPDGSPSKSSKRQVPKEKERRKRGSLKIGCPFRVQCTKNWKSGKMELRILEGRHNHPMESDRDNLPSQVRKIKEQRKAEEEQVNGSVVSAPPSAHPPHNFLNATPTSANLSMLTVAVPPNVAEKSMEVNPDVSAMASRNMPIIPTPPGVKPTLERNLLNLLGAWDRSDAAGKLIIEKELESTVQKAEAKLEKSQRKKRKISHSGTPAVSATPTMPLGAVTNHSRPSVGGAPMPRINGQQQQQQVAAAAAAAAASSGANAVDANGTPSGKGTARCSNCKQFGHNRRRCPVG